MKAARQAVQLIGVSRFAQRQMQRRRRLAPGADVCVRHKPQTACGVKLYMNRRLDLTVPEKLPCPACGWRTKNEEFYGSYETCPVCGWVDDRHQLEDPTLEHGFNEGSLLQFQKRSRRLPKTETAGFEHDLQWRPVMSDDLTHHGPAEEWDPWAPGDMRPEFAYWKRPRKNHNV